jgi:DNA-binding NarL/FixJ family response regulator
MGRGPDCATVLLVAEMTELTPMTDTPLRVVIIDDHPIVREALSNVIAQQADMRFAGEASNLPQAMELLAKERPCIAVIDLSLGEESGLDLLHAVRDKYDDVKMVVLSMHDETLFAERALRAGASAYVMKREATTALVESIRTVAAGRIHVSPKVADRLLKTVSRPRSAPRVGVETLTDRELDVFRLIGNGLGTRDVAQKLHLSVKTVETHRARIKEKLEISSATELVVRAAKWVQSGE